MPKLEQIKIAACFVITLLLSTPMAHAADDPFESFNRAMHEFNASYYGSASQGANQFFSDYMPDPVRKGITNFFSNLGETVTAASSLARGDVDNAEIAAKRFLYNLTLGFGGLVDRASELGVHSRPSGVGEVFCSYGVPEGPYLVLPFYGPATVADFFGSTLPILAGYATMGEAFWIYRASSRVASYMDDPAANSAPASGEGTTANTPDAAAQAAAAKAANEEAYRRMREQYLAAREAACKAAATAPSGNGSASNGSADTGEAKPGARETAAEPVSQPSAAPEPQAPPHGSLTRGQGTELAQAVP